MPQPGASLQPGHGSGLRWMEMPCLIVPGIIEQHRTVLAAKRSAFSMDRRKRTAGQLLYIRRRSIFLYTGRHAASPPVLPMPFCHEDREGIVRAFLEIPAFVREQRPDYLFLTATDYPRELPGRERGEVR